ncbi:MAG TPA: 2-dehydropantoate 2-reductase [Candidatus Hydrogenedentes bacterium]|nr:2-dehydropantoate 2-reductase [Candidatus Hydrogenedentota bacterium]
MRLLVVGAGAVGSSVGGFMAKAGHEVTLVGLDAHVETIREKGLRITGIWGDHHVANLRAQTDLSGLKAGDFDLILVSVKSYDTAAAAESFRHLLDAHTLVCSYQNGLGNAECIAAVAGWERTIGARVIYGVRRPALGHIEITVIANPTALGVYCPEAPVDRVRAIAEAMDAAGLPTEFTDRIATLLWGKVAYNSALNPLSALLGVPYGRLPETGHALAIMRDIVHELYAVAGAKGIALEPDSPEAYMDVLVNRLIPPTAAHFASMHEDFLFHRRTEIDALNGAISAYGREHGIPTPANDLLTRLVHAREALSAP